MVHLDLQPELEAQLASQAQARGLALSRYVEELLAHHPNVQKPEPPTRTIRQAIDRILELREGTHLGGLSIKDLINEGRKY